MLSTWLTTDETHLAPWDVCQVFCCDVVEGLSVFPSIIHSIICSIIVNHMIHGYLVYTLNCNPRLLKLFHPGSLRALFFGPCIPLTCPIILAFVFFFFFSTVLLSGITRCFNFILCISCPIPRICHFLQGALGPFGGIGNQNLGMGCTGCYWGNNSQICTIVLWWE